MKRSTIQRTHEEHLRRRWSTALIGCRAATRGTAWGPIALCLAILASSAPALAQADVAVLSGDLSRLSDRALEQRVDFLKARFRAQERHASYWQYGFTSAWATGAALGTLQASLSSEPDNRVPAIVTAAKATLGTTKLLLSPHPARLGIAPLEIERGDARSTLEARVRAGERHLLAIEHKARERKSWIAHAANIGLNAIGGGLIVALGNPSDAIQNVGVGILFGEAMILSMPKQGEQDLRDYQSFIAEGVRRPRKPRTSVAIVPTSRGGLLQIRF